MTTAIAAPAAPAAAPAAPPTGGNATPATGAPKPAETPIAKPPEQPWKVKRKLKVGGQEVEREYDDRRLQILEHNETQRAEHLKERSDFEARLKKITDDPDSLFDEVGFDVDGYLAQRAERAQSMKAMTPEQKRIAELEGTLAKKQAAEQKAAEETRVSQERAEHQAFVQQNVQRLGKAIELSGLPRSGELVRLYSEVQEMAVHAGEPEMSPEQLVSAGERLMGRRLAGLLKAASNEGWRSRNAETLSGIAKAVLPALEGESLLSWIGNENALRVVKAIHARSRSSQTPVVQDTPRPDAPTVPPAGKPAQGWDEAMDRLGY